MISVIHTYVVFLRQPFLSWHRLRSQTNGYRDLPCTTLEAATPSRYTQGCRHYFSKWTCIVFGFSTKLMCGMDAVEVRVRIRITGLGLGLTVPRKARLPYQYCSKNVNGYRRHPRSVVVAEVAHRAVPIQLSFQP